MFAIQQQLGAWTKSYFEYLTSSDQPTDRELLRAYGIAFRAVVRLEEWRERLGKWPNYSHEIRLIDQVLQALRDDHGGVRPYELLSS